MVQKIKDKWAAGQSISNAWVTIPNAWTAEIVAGIGYDVMTIDAQHGLASDLSIILPMLQSIEGSGTLPFVRLPQNDPAYIMRMLDAGVLGLICPMINTAADTARFVQAAKYYPKGFRSYGPTRAAALHGPNYFEKANAGGITMAMIETPDALKNIKEIVKTPDLDGLYVGPWDLSISLGYKKHADFDDPSFWDIMIEIAETCKEAGVQVGIHAGSPDNAHKFEAIGYRFVTIFNDSTGLKTAAKNAFEGYLGNNKTGVAKGY
jgi:4-hydroxy-2-oxoheptanedioate aldolase